MKENDFYDFMQKDLNSILLNKNSIYNFIYGKKVSYNFYFKNNSSKF